MHAVRDAVSELVKCFTVTTGTALEPPTLVQALRADGAPPRSPRVCGPVPALVTDVGPHALPSQCFLAALLTKLGHTVGMNTPLAAFSMIATHHLPPPLTRQGANLLVPRKQPPRRPLLPHLK